jgi:transcription elongation factor Elf1
MSISPYVCDCPECSSEIPVDLEATHRPFSDNEKMVYRVVCNACGLSCDVHFEDLRLGDH